MKFAANRTLEYTSKDRFLIVEREEKYYRNDDSLRLVRYFCCALIEVTRDWKEDDKFPVVSDTDSIQIRPKAIFKSPKGYYYKSNKTVYLTDVEVEQMNQFINNFLKQLK